MEDKNNFCQAQSSEESAEKKGVHNFQENYRCKITVLKKDFAQDLYEQYPYGLPHACGLLELGQVFYSDSRWYKPEGFCDWAWGDLRSVIMSLHSGQSFPMICCCTDGLRPVTFKLERVEIEDQ
jgi:uncharacterized repeat protein (TIGR04076 family)